MAYHTYITEAIVCGHDDVHGAHRAFYLFTRDLGMVYAYAQSVREERSKHRYALQVCGHVRVTLVRGKSGWRITGTEAIQNFYSRAQTRAERGFARATILLLSRFIHGETPHPELFDDVICACVQNNSESSTNRDVILTIRVLYMLGYIAPDPIVSPFVMSTFRDATRLNLNEDMKKHITQVIHHAHTLSHL